MKKLSILSLLVVAFIAAILCAVLPHGLQSLHFGSHAVSGLTFCVLGLTAVPAGNFPTLIDVAKLDKGSGYDVIVEAIFQHAEVGLFPAVTQPETTLDVSVLANLPTGSSFRRPNTGVQPSKAGFDVKRFDMALIDRRVEIDKDGVYARTKDKARLLVNQSVPQMEKALVDISTQIWYGKVDDTDLGFPGLFQQAPNDATHTINAAGTTALTSVWLLDIRPPSMELVFGADSTLTMGDDWKEETVYIPPNNDRLAALTNRIVGWCGFRLLNKHRAIRIKNIGTDATLTSTMLQNAISLCSVLGFMPTHIVGTERSFEQLRESYITALLPNPPRVNDFGGVPIVRTINITNAETAS